MTVDEVLEGVRWVEREDGTMLLYDGRPATAPLCRAYVTKGQDGYWWGCGVCTQALGQVERWSDDEIESRQQAQAEAVAYLRKMLADLHPRLLEVRPVADQEERLPAHAVTGGCAGLSL